MWTPTALASKVCHRAAIIWRAVEDQHNAATRKIVDTRQEQELLEDILEGNKPPIPKNAAALHYLLHTPFRYDAPYPVGSRFRRAGANEGVFYGSETIRTTLAELCYYRLRFFQESPDSSLPRQQARLTVFSVNFESKMQIDLTQPPFDSERKRWTDAADYSATQAFADSARQAGIEVIRYESVRDQPTGFNVALLSPSVFKTNTPEHMQTWFLYLSESEANCERANARTTDERWTFKWEQYI